MRSPDVIGGSTATALDFVTALPDTGEVMLATSGWTGLPFLARFTVVGAVGAFILGALVGLVVGLHAHAATAWFAVFELGIPAGVLGAILGAIAGVVAGAIRRLNHH